MDKKKVALLLTATLDPKGMFFLNRNNPIIREIDYIKALERWIHNKYLIVFCENSGYQSEKIKNIVKKNKNIEFIQFNGQGFPKKLGKGYGELLIIRYAVKNSEFIKHSDYVVKITGRHYIKNINRLINILYKENDAYIISDLKKNLTWADSRVFAFKPSFITDYLSKFLYLINDSKGFYLEHALARATLRAVSDGYKWMPLPCRPVIIGYAGTSDTAYKTSKIRALAGEIIHLIKNYLNKR